MEHVPTLCAISTVGIAAAGFALGHQEQVEIPRPTSNKRKAPGTSHTHRSFSSPLTGSTVISTRPPPKTPPMLNDSSRPLDHPNDRLATASSQKSVDGLGIQSEAGVIGSGHSGHGLTRSSTPGTEGSSNFEFKSSGLARPSWMRRISAISSQNESPPSSIRPASSSISFSNNSTAPMLSSTGQSPASLPPNKLVKRSSSQRALTPHQSVRSTSMPQGPTFRRPATSHQRSATMRQVAMGVDAKENTVPPFRDTPAETGESYEINESSTSHIWRPYFTRGYPKAVVAPRKRHTSGFSKNTSLSRVVRGGDTLPTLLLATEITPRLSEDELDDVGDRSFNLASSRPTSSFGLPSNSSPAQNSLQAHMDKEVDRKPRHSYSISDMFSAGSPGSWLPRSGSLRMKKNRSGADEETRNLSSPVPNTQRSLRRTGRLQRRRNITDGSIFETPSIYSAHLNENDNEDTMEGVMSSPLPQVDRMSVFNVNLPGGAPSYPSTPVIDSRNSPHSNSYLTSPPSASPSFAPISRPKRQSMTISEPNSTLVGSDAILSGDEMDFQSDSAYDSMATRATASSNSGIRGPRIETIFDESPPPEMVKGKLVALENLIQRGSFDERTSPKSSKHSTMDEDDDFPTPVRPTNDGNDDDKDAMFPLRTELASSPQMISSPLFSVSDKLNGLRLYTGNSDDDQADWDSDGAVEWADIDGPHESIEKDEYMTAKVITMTRQSTNAQDGRNGSSPGDSELKPSLFDWSEHQKHEKDSVGSNIRPKTVHGKHGVENRGSRAPGRRGPSVLHLRSQSVPVSREPVVPHESYSSAAKYGTWGLGNKGVSEDWNDDFDFEEEDEQPSKEEAGQKDDDSIGARSMRVPQAIMERQASVHGQFSQVQELNLLVEELKRLRASATLLGILDGQASELWKEAEGIINLATLDDDDDNQLQPSHSPSSPSFNFDAFDEDSPPAVRSRKQSMRSPDKGTPLRVHEDSDTPRRNSILRNSQSPMTPPVGGRPRKESSAKAKSVLETIYSQRGGFEPALHELRNTHKPGGKLPFDTQSLRDLVTRAGVVTRALKELVRKAENVSDSPDPSPERPRDRDPPFSQIFERLEESPSPSKKPGLPKSRSANGYLGSSFGSQEGDLSGHLKLMTVV